MSSDATKTQAEIDQVRAAKKAAQQTRKQQWIQKLAEMVEDVKGTPEFKVYFDNIKKAVAERDPVKVNSLADSHPSWPGVPSKVWRLAVDDDLGAQSFFQLTLHSPEFEKQLRLLQQSKSAS